MSTIPTTGAPSLVIRRTFNAPRERVFAAWTDPNLLGRWFCPEDHTFNGATIDARVGGNYRIATTAANGEAYNVHGTFTEFRPPERLAYTFRWEEDEPQLEHETLVSVDFFDRDGTTEMVFTHENFASDESRGRHDEGWTTLFGRLASLVERD